MIPTIPLLETLEITLTSIGVAELAFNRPNRYNALSPLAYRVNKEKKVSFIISFLNI